MLTARHLISLLGSLFLLATPAFAQQQAPDPQVLQAGLQALQAQRNRAMDEAASAEAQLAKAQQEIADLKKQLEPKPDKK